MDTVELPIAPDNARMPEGEPTFVHRDVLLEALDALFSYFQAPDIVVENVIKSSLLVKNAVVLLSGTYGTGKNQLVGLIRQSFFSKSDGSSDFWKVSCVQDLTPHDILYHLDLGQLQQGEEHVTPRPLIGARLKYVNEVQRATPLVHNSLLSLLAEHEVSYRDMVFPSPDYLCYLDRNPEDEGSSPIPRAFLDRVDYSIEIPAIGLDGALSLQRRKMLAGAEMWGPLDSRLPARLTSAQMAEVWDDVPRVKIPRAVLALANMVGFSFRVCVMVDRSVAHADYRLDCARCEFKAEVCSHIEGTPPAYRFIESGLRVAQARAWLSGRDEVIDDDFIFALPFVLGHRVRLRPELAGSWSHSQQWIMEDAWQTIRRKVPRWRRAIDAWIDGDREGSRLLHDMAENDLVVRELAASMSGTD